MAAQYLQYEHACSPENFKPNAFVRGQTYLTPDDFPADIFSFAVISVNTEVLGIIESTFVIPVRQTMSPDFF